MKKILSVILAIVLLSVFCVFALGSGESEVDDQGKGETQTTADDSNLGDYSVEIKSCRKAKDYSGKEVVIIKYGFTNNAEEPANFMFAFDDSAYQSGVGLNEAYILDDSANYSADNQTKNIKKGASIDVEVAYELNDTSTNVDVEVKELISFNNSVVKKSFELK